MKRNDEIDEQQNNTGYASLSKMLCKNTIYGVVCERQAQAASQRVIDSVNASHPTNVIPASVILRGSARCVTLIDITSSTGP